MAVLPYCILLESAKRDVPSSGVAQCVIQQVHEGELLALYSELPQHQISASNFRDSAVEFHTVVHVLFSQVAVVPFRFPTWLSLPDLVGHLQQHVAEYKQFLTRHANDVQMELRIPSSAGQGGHAATASSGTEHLRHRARSFRHMKETANCVRDLLGEHVLEWRQRDIPEGLRLYALVPRERVHLLREKLSKQAELGLRWSGPWPATEFLPDNNRG